MSKEEIKDDIINDINRLLSKDGKDTENLNELFKDIISFLKKDSLHFRNNVLGLFITKIKK